MTTPTPIILGVATTTYPSITTVTNNAWRFGDSCGRRPNRGNYSWYLLAILNATVLIFSGKDFFLIGTKPISPADPTT